MNTDSDNSDEMESVSALSSNCIKIHICFSEMKKKKYKEEKMKEIVRTICALLNSLGGTVTMEFKAATEKDVQNLKRAIEQRLSDILGFSSMRDHIDFVSSRTDGCVFIVKGVSSLCTMNYNLSMPSETQVLAVLPKATIVEIGEILSSEKRFVEVEKVVEIGTHHNEFVFQQRMTDGLLESKTIQLKCLKAEKSKCVTLGDRMINKANKFAKYVSAFANHRGGHIYYGVEDDGVVKGEFVEDEEEITKKVSKAINNMVWSTKCEEPKRGQHWEIFFEPVHGVNGDVVPSTFVIVVYIARCAGGVFTEVPESYHVVNGEVKKMEYNKWRERFFQMTSPQHVARVQWSSKGKKQLLVLMEKMIHLRNSGDKARFESFIRQVKQNDPSIEVQLIILSQEAAFANRRSEPVKAKLLIEKYHELMCKNEMRENHPLFQCLELLIQSASERSLGNFKKSYDLATSGLQFVELVSLGSFTAWFYLHIASQLTAASYACPKDHDYQIALAKVYGKNGLWYAQSVNDCPNETFRADTQQAIYIHLACTYLACSTNGTIHLKADVPDDDITCAKNCLMKVQELTLEGHELSSLREIEFRLAHSSLFVRQSQLLTSTQQPLLESSVYSKKLQICQRGSQMKSAMLQCEEALKLAKKSNLREMVQNTLRQKAYVTEKNVSDAVKHFKPGNRTGVTEHLLTPLSCTTGI